MPQRELESRIQVLLAGSIAEEMIFDDVPTGAQNDLERATEIARSMVMDFGMSRLGRVTYRENPSARFLGTDEWRERSHSEQTAREIDEEIKDLPAPGSASALWCSMKDHPATWSARIQLRNQPPCVGAGWGLGRGELGVRNSET